MLFQSIPMAPIVLLILLVGWIHGSDSSRSDVHHKYYYFNNTHFVNNHDITFPDLPGSSMNIIIYFNVTVTNTFNDGFLVQNPIKNGFWEKYCTDNCSDVIDPVVIKKLSIKSQGPSVLNANITVSYQQLYDDELSPTPSSSGGSGTMGLIMGGLIGGMCLLVTIIWCSMGPKQKSGRGYAH